MEAFKLETENLFPRVFCVEPSLYNEVQAVGEVRLVPANTRVIRQRTESDFLVLVLTGSLRILLSTGRIGQESVVDRIESMQLAGLRDILDGRPYAYSAVTDTDCTLLFVSRTEFLLLLRQRPRLAHALKILSSSQSLLSFAEFLLDEKVEQNAILNLLVNIQSEPIQCARQQAFRPKDASIYFVQSGYVQIRSFPDAVSAFSSGVSEGSWFGGCQLSPPHRMNYEVSVTSETYLHQLATSDAIAHLPAATVEKLAQEIGIQDSKVLRPLFLAREAKQVLAGTPRPISDLLGLGFQVDIHSFDCQAQPQFAAIATLRNFGLLTNQELNLANIDIDLSEARSLTLLRLAEILERHGYMCRAIQTSVPDLKRQILPALATLGGRPCILVAVHRTSVVVLDPTTGLLSMRKTDFQEVWNGQVLECQISVIESALREGERKGFAKNPDQIAYTVFQELQKGPKKIYRNLLGLQLFHFFMMLAYPMFFHQLIDKVLKQKDQGLLATYIQGLFLILLFQTVARIAADSMQAQAETKLSLQLRSIFYRQFLQIPLSNNGEARSSEVITRFQLLEFVARSVSRNSLGIMVTALSLGMYGFVLFVYSWQVGLIVLALSVVSAVISVQYVKRTQRDSMGVSDIKRKHHIQLAEHLEGVTTMKASGSEDYLRHRSENAYFEYMRTTGKISQRNVNSSSVIDILSVITGSICVYVLINGAMYGQFSLGQAVAVTLYLGMCLGPIRRLAELLAMHSVIEGSYRGIGALVRNDLDYSLRTSQMTRSLSLEGRIRLERVSFRYENSGPNTLNDISLTIQPGQVIAIVGQSGSGKSTLAKLLAGHLKPVNGKVLFDEHESHSLSMPSIREQIGYIDQNPVLFSGSVASNIAFSEDVIDRDRVQTALRLADAGRTVAQLPNGLDYFINPSNCPLSVGEKQKLNLARILYCDPKVLIVDQATAHLDPNSEKAVWDQIMNHFEGRTLIIVALRLSSTRHADKIFVLKNGTLVESGEHNDLMKRNGEYAEIFRNQVGTD